jgi:hypothetical protein
MQLHHLVQIQRRVQERGSFGLSAHALEGLRHLFEERRIRAAFPKLLQFPEGIAIDEVCRIKGFLPSPLDQGLRVAMQRPDPRMNKFTPNLKPAVLTPKIQMDSLDRIVIARAQRPCPEAQQFSRQQPGAVPHEFQAQVPGAPPVEPDGIEVVGAGGNASFIALPNPPPHPSQRA